MALLVVLSGQKRSGKDTIAKFIKKDFEKINLEQNILPHNFKIVGFADKIKDVVCDIFGITRDYIEEWKDNPTPPPGFLVPMREMLTDVGDGYRRFKPSIWIDYLYRNAITDTVVADGRYKNEAIAGKERGGFNVLIHRPGFENEVNNPSELWTGGLVKLLNQNSIVEGYIPESIKMEYDIGCYDYIIRNEGTLEDLDRKVQTKLMPVIRHYFGV